MSLAPAMLAALVILVFVGIVLLMFRASKKYQAEKSLQAQSLGFEPVGEIPAELLNRVEDLYKNKNNPTLEIENLYQRSELDSVIYLFDLIGTDNEDSTLGTEIFGVISKELALPRFSLTTIPAFARQGGIGALMDKLMDKVMDMAAKHQELSRIEFPDRPSFDDQCIVFGNDEHAVRDLMKHINLDRYSREYVPLHIAGLGDFLTVDFSYISSGNDPKNLLETQYRGLGEIIRWFERKW